SALTGSRSECGDTRGWISRDRSARLLCPRRRCYRVAVTNPSAIFARAHEALERDDLAGVRAAATEAAAAGVDEDDPRSRHLQFMLAWLDESTGDDEIEQLFADAGELLEAAAALSDANTAARIIIDITDALASAGEFDDAEHALRALSE